MTKKHFIALADSIEEHNRCAKDNTSYTAFTTDQLSCLMDFCRHQNYNFNSERWLSYIAGTCGPNGGKVKVSK